MSVDGIQSTSKDKVNLFNFSEFEQISLKIIKNFFPVTFYVFCGTVDFTFLWCSIPKV